MKIFDLLFNNVASVCTGPLAPLSCINYAFIEQFSYDLEMKTCEQNRNKKRKEVGRFDWLIERIQTRVAFGWFRERSGEKTSWPRTF